MPRSCIMYMSAFYTVYINNGITFECELHAVQVYVVCACARQEGKL